MFKKIILAALFVASFVSAETIGIHAAGTMSSLWGDDADGISSKIGFNAGFAGKVAFKDLPITIAPEVLIDMRRVGSDDDDDFTLTEWALDIPVMVRFEVLKLFFVEAGPSFDFNLNTSSETKVLNKTVETDYDENTFEFGLAFGVGTDIIPMVDIDFRVNLGLTDIFDKPDYGNQVDASNLQFALGVSFWIM